MEILAGCGHLVWPLNEVKIESMETNELKNGEGMFREKRIF